MKKFIAIGNLNSTTYKEIFPYIVEQLLWMGPSITTGGRWFIVPEEFYLKDRDARERNGNKEIRIGGVRWLTNVPVKKTPDVILTEKYKDNSYEIFDDYEIINIDKVKDIPYDYDKEIAVPITILDRLLADGHIHFRNAEFKIKGILNTGKGKYDYARPFINGKEKFKRIIIERV